MSGYEALVIAMMAMTIVVMLVIALVEAKK